MNPAQALEGDVGLRLDQDAFRTELDARRGQNHPEQDKKARRDQTSRTSQGAFWQMIHKIQGQSIIWSSRGAWRNKKGFGEDAVGGGSHAKGAKSAKD